MKILITGAAGFIGSMLTLRLLARGDTVAFSQQPSVGSRQPSATAN